MTARLIEFVQDDNVGFCDGRLRFTIAVDVVGRGVRGYGAVDQTSPVPGEGGSGVGNATLEPGFGAGACDLGVDDMGCWL